MANEYGEVDQLAFREMSDQQLRSLAAKWVEQQLFDPWTSEIGPLHVSVTRLQGREESIIPCDKDVARAQRTFLRSLLEREHALQYDLRGRLERVRVTLEDEREKLRSLRRKENFEQAKLASCDDAQERDVDE